jgi:uncharacterized repeat protein (TIGR01451 family)
MIQGTGLAPEMDVQGNGQSIPDDDATPSVDDHTDFGNLDILNDSLEYTFTITNTGGIDLNLTGTPIVQVTGTHASDFTVVQQPASNTVAAGGGTVTFVVRFNPSATGLRSAEITISNDDSDENPYNFSIQGTGTAVPEMDVLGNSISITDGDATPSVSDSTDFGSGDILTDIIVRTYTIANTGSAVLNLTGAPRVVIGGVNAGDFLVNRQPASGTVAAGGGTLTFQVTFNPTLTGLRQATVSISNDDSDENPYNFSIQGTGTAAPEITVYGNSTEITSGDLTPDPADHTDFGNTEISGPDITRRFKIYNVGSAAVNLTNPSPYVSIGGTHAADFSVTAIPVTPLTEYGDSTEFEITFNPSAEGVRTATLSIANNDGDENPYVFAIQGTGNPDPVPILVLSKIVDKGNASPGEELTYTINYENIGTGDATSITILEPVPSNTTFVQGSITAGGMTITYSHNNGASYDGSDAAPVTHIRFNRSGALPAGGSGSIIFRVTIN